MRQFHHHPSGQGETGDRQFPTGGNASREAHEPLLAAELVQIQCRRYSPDERRRQSRGMMGIRVLMSTCVHLPRTTKRPTKHSRNILCSGKSCRTTPLGESLRGFLFGGTQDERQTVHADGVASRRSGTGTDVTESARGRCHCPGWRSGGRGSTPESRDAARRSACAENGRRPGRGRNRLRNPRALQPPRPYAPMLRRIDSSQGTARCGSADRPESSGLW